jgi:uncharacterized protein RhaS with RHS repeats
MKTISFLMFIMCFISFSLMGQTNELRDKHETPLNHEIRIFETEKQMRNADRIASQPRTHQPKSTLAVKQKLDSVITESYYDVSGQFVNSRKETYLYDANGNLTQRIYYTTNEVTGQWQLSYKLEHTYDTNGNMTLEMAYFWNETTSQWHPFWKYKYENTYDANGNNTVHIRYGWSETTSQWQPSTKVEYTYDANGNITLYIGYNWNSTTSQWQPYDKVEYTYDANGNRTLYIYYYWNETTSQWQPSDKVEYTYDANGNNTLYISYNWNSTTSQWQPSDKVEYTYDANGNITLYIGYNWNSTTSQWQPYDKVEYTYDANGNNTLLIYYDWNETTSQWLPYYKDEYTYDNSFLYINLILPPSHLTVPPLWYYDEEFMNNMILMCMHYNWDVNTSSFINDIRVAFYYSEHNTGIANSSEIGIKIYPNPANETLHIVSSAEINSISIYDIAGKLILTQEVIDKTCEVALLDTKPGIYFIEISCDSKTVIQKIVKQ